QKIGDRELIRWIKSLAIPPAYRDVWISPFRDGHLLATGRDARGRKQYRYHPQWHAVRDETKYDRLLQFGAALPALRERTAKDLARPGLPRAKILATVVRLLEATLIRVGNAEYARLNQSFGLTTMRDRHVTIEGTTLRFTFRGKGGIPHTIDLDDRRLAGIVRRCRDLTGYELFQYLDPDGAPQSIGSGDVNDYLREAMGEEFTAKDFRTWAGTMLATAALRSVDPPDSETAGRRAIAEVVRDVAARLGNTPAICRKCYIHPLVLETFLEGGLANALERSTPAGETGAGLDPDEVALLNFLRKGV
ncbi:MAG: DNA topoisomerase IB, partial [Gemmatimonadota bacterium]